VTCSRRRFVGHAARSALAAAGLLVLTAVGAQSSVVPGDASGEARIKAAFICKFGNYIEWPKGGSPADGAFVIGVIAGSKLVGELTQAANGQTVNGRPVIVRKLERIDPANDLSVVFVARGNAVVAAEMLALLRGRPILTITEAEDAGPPGSMVNFVIVDDRVRFDISLQPAEQSSLKISGRLLALARKVTGAPS